MLNDAKFRLRKQMLTIFTKRHYFTMKNIWVTSIILLLASCTSGESQIKEIATLQLKEASGLEYLNGELWTHEDSGNTNKIYNIGLDGSIKKEVTITNAKNNDWEDIAAGKQGNLYIGDFGNNHNNRKNLAIYKLDAGNLSSVAYTVSFYYPEQKEFPPKKSNLIYDVESFFEHNGNFYLFTKNRSKGFDGSVNIYMVPNKQGNHAAKLMGTIVTCDNYRKCAITSADISPDGTKVILLSGAKIWLITNFGTDNFAGGKIKEIDLHHVSQKEGICFKDNDTLYIVDEKDKKEGGKLYEAKLSKL